MNIYIYTHINTYLNKTTLINQVSEKSSCHILPYCFRIVGEVGHLKKNNFQTGFMENFGTVG